MKVTIDLDKDYMHRLYKLVIQDQDTADKQALEGLLWNIAHKAGICDEDGNLTGGER